VQAVGVTGLKKMDDGIQDLSGQLLKWCYIIHNPIASAISSDHQVIVVFLHHHMMKRSMREIVLQRYPVFSIRERYIDSVFSPKI
jgi:hypothetical protein